MRKRLIFAIVALLLLAPWPVAYAFENNLAGASVIPLEVVAAPGSAAPRCQVYGRAIGSVTPGDLFYINMKSNAIDSLVTLYITNTDELSQYYRYMTLRVGIYTQTEEQWQKLDGLPETFVTLNNGLVSFTLPGLADYKVTIDGGCFYSLTAAGSTEPAPKFYLTAE
ncbi:MAG: hypothetical protein PHR56_04650 [Dehalococcoidales bacterium]|nr:hypothetical protein [Dehalococcoidales bacterium]